MIHAAVNLLWCAHGRVGGSEEYLVRQLTGLADVATDITCELHLANRLADAHPTLARHQLAITRLDVDRRPFASPPSTPPSPSPPAEPTSSTTAAAPRRSGDEHRRVVTVHDLQYLRLPQYFSRARLTYLRAMMGQSIRRATVITTPTAHVAATVTEAFDIDPERIVVVPHGVPAAEVSDADIAESRRTHLGDTDGRLVVLPAITHPHKGHLRMIAAFSRWSRADDRLVLIGGAGAAEERVTAAISASGIADRISRPGRVSEHERDRLIAAADIVALPSEEEGFGAPVVEAMAAGTAVVVSDIPALHEVAAGAAAIATDTDNGLVDALDEAIADRTRLEAAGRERAGRYTTEASGRALASAYRRAVGREDPS